MRYLPLNSLQPLSGLLMSCLFRQPTNWPKDRSTG